MEELFISFWCVDFEKCPSQIYYFEQFLSSSFLVFVEKVYACLFTPSRQLSVVMAEDG
jgi:hypothetical protein